MGRAHRLVLAVLPVLAVVVATGQAQATANTAIVWTAPTAQGPKVEVAPTTDNVITTSCYATGNLPATNLQALTNAGGAAWSVPASSEQADCNSAPVVDLNGNVYFRSYAPDGSSESLESRDGLTGTIRWKIALPGTGSWRGLGPVLGWNGTVLVDETMPNSYNGEILGFDTATGLPRLSLPSGDITGITAYTSGLALATDGGQHVSYYDYAGTLRASYDLTDLFTSYSAFSAAPGLNGAIFLAGYSGYCDSSGTPNTATALQVAEVAPTGIKWTWSDNKPHSCSQTALTPTPNGGVILARSAQNEVDNGAYQYDSISPTGTLLWTHISSSSAGDVVGSGGYIPSAVDTQGHVVLPSTFQYPCAQDPTIMCRGVQLEFFTQDSVTPYEAPIVSARSNSRYSLTDLAIDTGRIYIGIEDSIDFTSRAEVDAFDVSDLGSSYRSSITTPPQVRSPEYVALGDSYSSGEGNPPYAEPISGCDRSQTSAWPTILANSVTNIKPLALIACSGATTSALTTGFKGQLPQLISIDTVSPKLVTITIGGDDIGFATVLETCVLANCVKNGTLARTSTLINDLASILPDEYNQIKAAAPGAKITVVGYPRLFPPLRTSVTKGCKIWLTVGEQNQLNVLAAQLDNVIATAAAAAGVSYTPTLTAFIGHELCSGSSYVYPLRPFSSASGHPTPAGGRAIANLVRAKLGV